MKLLGKSLLALAGGALLLTLAAPLQAAPAGAVSIGGWSQWHPHFDNYPIAGVGTQVFFGKGPAEPAPVVKPVDTDGDGLTDNKDRCPRSPAGAKVNAEGCWTVTVHFDTGKSVIKAADAKTLTDAAKMLAASPATKMATTGHTDSKGVEKANQSLSDRRAKAVKDFLAKKGVGADRISTSALGQTKPVADNASETGRAMNRRTEIIELP